MRSRLAHSIASIVVISLAIAACSGGGGGSAAREGGVPTISDAWVRSPMGPGMATAGYLTITGGSTDDALVGASSPAAGEIQVHETIAGGSGMAGMQEVGQIEIPAGGTVTLEPGGYHLMIMEPDAAQLAVGETVEITLTFEGAGEMTVEAEVRAGG
jgi:copper(I)-binding protein